MRLVQDPRLPQDLRIICVDPRWCLTKEDANAVGEDLAKFMEAVRELLPPPVMKGFNACDPPPKKRGKRPLPSKCPRLIQEEADRVAKSQNVRSKNPHLLHRTREKMIEDGSTAYSPTPLLQDIARILIKAAEKGRGDFVNLSYNCTGHKTHYDHGMHMFSMTLQLAAEFYRGLDEIEYRMFTLMEPHRKNPSLLTWLENYVTNHEAVNSGAFKACRVYPSIGSVVNFEDQSAMSQISLQEYPYVSMARNETWDRKSVCGNPRLHTDFVYLWNHNQRLLPIEYGKLDFRKLPTDPGTDRREQYWKTYLDIEQYDWAMGPEMPDKVGNKKKLKIFVDGWDDFRLFDYVPWDDGEISSVTGDRTRRMCRNRRQLQSMFLLRSFTIDPDQACLPESCRMCHITRVTSSGCFPKQLVS